MENKYKSVITILVCTLILLLPAIINGYPFMFNDSVDYLSGRGYIYRPPVYTYFANIGTIFNTTWVIVIAQTILCVFTISLFCKYFIHEYSSKKLVIITAILAAVSSLPNFTGFIMADLFTSLSFLCIFILAFKAKELKWYEYVFLIIFGLFSITAHVSNLIINLGFIIFLCLAKFFSKEIKVMAPIILTIVAGLSLTALNGYQFKSYSVSPSGSVFMMANLSQSGLTQKYLKTACAIKQYKVCQYLNIMPLSSDKFLWSTTGVLYKMGGFNKMHGEAQIIVKETIKSYPIDFSKMAFTSFTSALITHTPYMEIQSKTVFPAAQNRLLRRYGFDAYTNLMNSLQMRDKFPIELIKTIDKISISISLLIIFGAIIYNLYKFKPTSLIIIGSFIVFTLVDTFVCSVTSGVFDRYQARVTWLLVLGAILVINNKMLLNKELS